MGAALLGRVGVVGAVGVAVTVAGEGEDKGEDKGAAVSEWDA